MGRFHQLCDTIANVNFVKELALASCLLTVPYTSFGIDFSGVVNNSETNEPVDLALVELQSLDNKTLQNVYADSLGRFQLKEYAGVDSCRLIVSAFGYESLDSLVGKGIGVPLNILLKPKYNRLGEVTVTSEQVTRIDGGYRIIPSKNQVKHSFGGYGLLYNLMIPGVQVDQTLGTVSAFGSLTKISKKMRMRAKR